MDSYEVELWFALSVSWLEPVRKQKNPSKLQHGAPRGGVWAGCQLPRRKRSHWARGFGRCTRLSYATSPMGYSTERATRPDQKLAGAGPCLSNPMPSLGREWQPSSVCAAGDWQPLALVVPQPLPAGCSTGGAGPPQGAKVHFHGCRPRPWPYGLGDRMPTTRWSRRAAARVSDQVGCRGGLTATGDHRLR